MTIQEAMQMLTKKVPGFIPIGYWMKSDGYIFKTKPIKIYRNLQAPLCYVVRTDGVVYGTNPMHDDLNPSTMKKI